MNKDSIKQAIEFHKKNPVLLSYVNPSMRFQPDGNLSFAGFFDNTEKRWSLRHTERGGVNAMVVSMGFGSGPEVFPGKAGVGRQFQVISNFISEVEKNKKRVEIATSYSDIKRITREKKTALIMHLTGVSLDGDLAVLKGLYELGIRSIHPPFDNRCPEVDNVKGKNGGLTAFGKKAVERTVELGMLVDVAHCTDTSFWQIMKIVPGPLIDSHANCRHIAAIPRNLTDRQIEAIAERNGAIGIHFAANIIDKDFVDRMRASGFYDKLKAWDQKLRKKHKDPFKYLCERINPEKWEKSSLRKLQQSVERPPIGMLIDHVDHLVKIGGIGLVGVGTDYDLGTIPWDLETADKLPNLTIALWERGYSKRDIKKILADNVLRVIKAVL